VIAPLLTDSPAAAQDYDDNDDTVDTAAAAA